MLIDLMCDSPQLIALSWFQGADWYSGERGSGGGVLPYSEQGDDCSFPAGVRVAVTNRRGAGTQAFCCFPSSPFKG